MRSSWSQEKYKCSLIGRKWLLWNPLLNSSQACSVNSQQPSGEQPVQLWTFWLNIWCIYVWGQFAGFYLLIFMVSYFFLNKKKISKCRVSFSFCLQFHRLFMKQRNKASVWLVKWNLFTKVKFQVLWFSAIDICQVGKFFWLPSSFIEQKHIFFFFWFVNCTVVNCFP